MVAYRVDALQPTNLALQGALSTLEFNQDGEELAKKREHVLEMTKLLVEKAKKCHVKQINAGKREVKYEVS